MKTYHWIDDTIEINFSLPNSILPLLSKLEELDIAEDYAYFNYSEALDCAAKELVRKGCLSTQQWMLLCAKYNG